MATASSPSVQVFIVYAHNPEEYTQLQPPEGLGSQSEEAKRAFIQRTKLHDKNMRDGITRHEKLVKTFAAFLNRNGVNAVLDQHIADEGTENLMKWTQNKIEASRFVILVITRSFLPFLEGKPRPPQDPEYIFCNDYLYNKIHLRVEGGPEFLPVFLNQRKDCNLLPIALKASSMYEIHEEEMGGTITSAPKSEDLLSLYCRITGQNRYSRPAIGKPVGIPVPPVRRPFGPKHGMTEEQLAILNRLSTLSCPLPAVVRSKLAENDAFSKYWRDIGTRLGLSQVELAQCEQHRGTGEQCYQMLKMGGRTIELSVSKMAEAVRQTEQYQLFEIIDLCLGT